MTAPNDRIQDPDRVLWSRAAQAYRGKGDEEFRPSPEELAQFLDGTADEAARERVFRWLADGTGAVEELRVLREPLLTGDRVDPALLETAAARARALVATPPEKPEEAHPSPLRAFLLDFLLLRNRLATAFAVCLLIITSAVACRLGISTFQNRRQAEAVLVNELTFGLSGVLSPQGTLPQPLSSRGGS